MSRSYNGKNKVLPGRKQVRRPLGRNKTVQRRMRWQDAVSAVEDAIVAELAAFGPTRLPQAFRRLVNVAMLAPEPWGVYADHTEAPPKDVAATVEMLDWAAGRLEQVARGLEAHSRSQKGA